METIFIFLLCAHVILSPPCNDQSPCRNLGNPDGQENAEPRFQCPHGLLPVSLEDYNGYPIEEILLLPSAALQVTFLQNGTVEKLKENFMQGEFYSQDNTTNFTICREKIKTGLTLYTKIYISLLFVSNFFVLLTILVYIFLKELRCNLFGKLTIGFLINVFFGFLFTGVHYSLNLKANTHLLGGYFCKSLAYLIQHFFLAFFFWLSTMAINITYTFSNLFKLRTKEKKKIKAFLLESIIYSQGVPLLISTITYLIDQYGTDKMILPNMGKYSCFIGSAYGNETSHFFKSAKFLYFYLIISLVMVANIICFIITGSNLVITWYQIKNFQKHEKMSGHIMIHLMILAKVFVIMGVPWVGDIVSASLAHTYKDRYSEANLVLDIINLLSGVLIFIVLVCKRSVLISLKKIIKNICSSEFDTLSRNAKSLNLKTEWTPTTLAVTKVFFFRTCLPFIDVGTDISSFLYLYNKGHHNWATLTLMWMFVPFAVNLIIVTNDLILAIVRGQPYTIKTDILVRITARQLVPTCITFAQL